MKKIITIIFIIIGFCYFRQIGETNYEKQKEIQRTIVEQPNFLPSKSFAIATSFGYKNLKADYYRLKTIQYIGGNVISNSYKQYLFKMIDLITELNPYFAQPYITGEILLPGYNPRYEDLTKEKQKELIKQAEEIGLKGVKNFCNFGKIEKIEKEENLEKLFSDKKYKNPCKNPEIPYNLGFIYYFYLKDYKNSEKFYKIASVTDGAPEGAKNLISIIKGRGGERKKSFFMFLNMANYTGKDDKVCKSFSNELKNIGEKIFKNPESLDGFFLKNLENLIKKNIEEETSGLSEGSCGTFLNKAIRELNIFYLNNANKKYFEKYNKNANFPQELFKDNFINYIPIDFQQEENSGIIYFYNSEINGFDYKMGVY